MQAKEGLVSGLVGNDRQTDLTLGLVGLADEGKVNSQEVDGDKIMLNVDWRIYFRLHDCQNIGTNWHEENSTDKTNSCSSSI